VGRLEQVDAVFAALAADDELHRARIAALALAVDVARDRGTLTGDHPGADAVLVTAAEFADFICNGGGKP
jgi:predicted RNA-binding protein with EMAP domain